MTAESIRKRMDEVPPDKLYELYGILEEALAEIYVLEIRLEEEKRKVRMWER